MKILVFESNNKKVVFEPKENQNLNSVFREAEKWLNSRCLRTGHFPDFACNENLCRLPTAAEINDYQVLKDHSIHALNAG